MSRYRVGHSPDADDIFMYYAIKFGWVKRAGIELENEAKDIQTLNDDTLNGLFDISAISFGLYPKVREDYALLKCAVSFGNGYGPKLVKRIGTTLKRNFKVALSGKDTTNALLFKIAYPQARITYMNFLQIEKAILEGVVDAGVLIHESILDFSPALEVERELWDIWQNEAPNLPLPLGGMAIRRSIPLLKAIEIEQMLIEAVEVANARKAELSELLIAQNLVRVDDEKLNTYLNMYANAESASMNETQYQALDRLFEIGYKHGFYECAIKAKEYTIPTEYKQTRFE